MKLYHPRFSGEAKLTWYMCVHTERFILKNWLAQLLGLTSLDYTAQASRLELTQDFCVTVWKQNCFFPRKIVSFSLQVFYCLEVAHPHYAGSSALL